MCSLILPAIREHKKKQVYDSLILLQMGERMEKAICSPASWQTH